MAEESNSVKDSLEWISLFMEVFQAVGTVAIALAGFAFSHQEKKAAEYNNRRTLVKEAVEQIDMDYAISVFQDRVFQEYTIGEGDYGVMFSTKIQFPGLAWQRKCRSRLMIFLETIRPCARILGGDNGKFAIEGDTDPILFKFRLSIKAMGAFWSPQGGLISACNDEHRNYIRNAYGSSKEWSILCKAIEVIGMKGRLSGPWDDAFETNA